MFRGSVGAYPELIRQMDLAEEDLLEADESIRALEERQIKGEISLEVYKRTVSDYQKLRDNAQSAVDGILMRLREKIR